MHDLRTWLGYRSDKEDRSEEEICAANQVSDGYPPMKLSVLVVIKRQPLNLRMALSPLLIAIQAATKCFLIIPFNQISSHQGARLVSLETLVNCNRVGAEFAIHRT